MMKNYFKAILFLMIIVQGCNKSDDENIELLPSPEYPFTYVTLSQQEMSVELQKFNSFNTIESLTLNEFGILLGELPINLSSGRFLKKYNVCVYDSSPWTSYYLFFLFSPKLF